MAKRPLITANMVTTARLLGMPILAWMIYQGETGWIWALVLGTLIGCTDFVDGYLARKHGPTVLGGLLDPIADKVLIAAWYLPLADVGVLPAWPVAVLFLREFLVTGLRSAFEQRDLAMKTSYLAKVKTWAQMQGLGVAVLIVLTREHTTAMAWVLGIGALLPLVIAGIVWLVRKSFYRSAVIMSLLQGLVFVLYLILPYQQMVLLVLLGIVVLTWISGADYILGGYPRLRRAGDFGAADFVRLAGAVSVPLAAVFCLSYADVPFVAVGGVVALELAVGGLDNLLSHHRAQASAGSWAIRSLGASALLAAAAGVSIHGHTELAVPLAFAGMALSLLGTAREFWRGSDYYLDARLRDKALASTPASDVDAV